MTDSDRVIPKVTITMPPHKFVIMELSSAGFGSPGELMRDRVDLVLDAYDYLRFKNKYEHQTYLMRDRKCN